MDRYRHVVFETLQVQTSWRCQIRYSMYTERWPTRRGWLPVAMYSPQIKVGWIWSTTIRLRYFWYFFQTFPPFTRYDLMESVEAVMVRNRSWGDDGMHSENIQKRDERTVHDPIDEFCNFVQLLDGESSGFLQCLQLRSSACLRYFWSVVAILVLCVKVPGGMYQNGTLNRKLFSIVNKCRRYNRYTLHI